MKVIKRTGFHCLLMALVFINLLPLIIILSSSLRSPKNLTSPLKLFIEFSVDSFQIAFGRMNYLHAFANSLMITIVAVAFVVVFAGMAAYPMARIRSRGSRFLYMFFLAGLVVPAQMVIIPVVQMISALKIPSTQFTPIIMFITCSLPFSTFLYTGFIRSSVPAELEESAYIDGAGLFRRFWQIVFPLIKPATISVIITQGVWIWNDYFLNMMFITKSSEQPLPLAMLSFMGDKQNPTQWNILFAACILCALPLIAIFSFLQRYFMEGLAAGAVKG